MSLKPESRWSATINQLFGAIIALILVAFGAGVYWYKNETRLATIETALTKEVVTWHEAKLYAAKLDGANRGIGLVVPEPNTVR
jgi:predicted permease